MACPHVCGLVTALMTANGPYSDIIKDDKSLRTLLNDKFVMDIGVKGPDNATGLGFLTYLNKKEYKKLWKSGLQLGSNLHKNICSTEYIMKAITIWIGINQITGF